MPESPGSNPTQRERVLLRSVKPADLEVFFEHQQEEEACRMAAFTSKDPKDRAAFDAHWERIQSNPNISTQTIVVGDSVAGHVASWVQEGEREITYWVGREFWGQGVATAALRAFLVLLPPETIFARVAHDNVGSIQVLKKCGFERIREERGFANARGEEIDEFVYQRPAPR